MAQSVDAITFKKEESFDAAKMQKGFDAIKQDFDGQRSEINALQKGKLAVFDAGAVDSIEDINSLEISSDTLIKYEIAGNQKLAILIGGVLIPIVA